MIQSDTVRNVINFVLFQAGWFACVLYPGLAAVGGVAVLLAFHLTFISQARSSELQFIGFGVVLGGLLDGLWFNLGVLDNGVSDFQLTPIWIIGLWAAFMTTLSHSLSWIGSKPWLPFVCAPVAGPLAYWSASKMGAVDMPDLAFSLTALALGWLVIFPLLLYVRKTLYPELAQ
ncbi:DUF2878 domain-containing protein [Marinobacter sp. CHS3-4]|uniref:DUF2878 domain-containing protein n=1 Tax=Marinobacter sp. CHS3-4 TaxID=3045174 RepID=UPI0024B52BEC|nr:DUF2878 domain-containing protein [Marinobacter sp. CHS3-4]MDI9245448.1 DUF2878 domain-containing protein [Marinobacter sp. CHS3-4]